MQTNDLGDNSPIEALFVSNLIWYIKFLLINLSKIDTLDKYQ